VTAYGSVATARTWNAAGSILQRGDGFCLESCNKLAGAEERLWWQWSLFSVAEVNGRTAAALCGFGDRALYTATSVATAEASQKMGLSKEEPFSAKAAERVHSSHAL